MYVYFSVVLIILAGDVEINPGPIATGHVEVNPGDPGITNSRASVTEGLSVLYLNARSLKAFVPLDGNLSSKVCKVTILQQLVYRLFYDVICISETWLNDSFMSTEILTGYSIYRKDRTGKIGGGVLIAVKSEIHTRRRSDLERDNIELVVVELTKDNSKPIILYSFYHPEACPVDFQHLNSSLQETPESACNIVVGDFNLPDVVWSSDECTPTNVGGSSEVEAFCDLMGDNFLQQFIKGPTHIAGNKLDLLLCNCSEVIDYVSTSSPVQSEFPSDHFLVDFVIRLKFKRAKRVQRKAYDYKRANFDELRSDLQRVPFVLSLSDDVDICWSQWKDLFLTAVEIWVPVKYIKDTNSPPWIDGEVRHLIRKKYRALRKYRQYKSEERKLKLRSLSQEIKSLVRRKHRDYLISIEGSFKSNPKLFWSYHKAILHHRAGLNSDIIYNGQTAKTSVEKAELFNSYFCSVFTSPTANIRRNYHRSPLGTDMEISELNLSVDEVADCLSNLDPTKACGPDGIPARILKECSVQIAPSLCALFNHSLHTGRFPSEWKTADVIPVHKKDLKESAENYRPISLLSVVSKVMERCVCNRFNAHVSHVITQLQHGFMRNRSCVTHLLSVLHSIGEALDKNIQSDVLYLDFAKAFDSVDHAILIEKLKCYGVTGKLLEWFTDYLRDRSQRVVIEGVASHRSTVTSGVPQGSIAGPLLFVLFINDLPDVIQKDTGAALYADDTKLYRTINSLSHCESLQRDLTSLVTWSRDSNIKFNASKCKVLTVTRKKTPVAYDYHLGDVKLLRVREERDLGVIISDKLSWDSHVTAVVAKANKLLGLLKRTCPLITDITVRRTLYLALVKSQMCYATEVWSPATVKLKSIVERVQRRATP